MNETRKKVYRTPIFIFLFAPNTSPNLFGFIEIASSLLSSFACLSFVIPSSFLRNAFDFLRKKSNALPIYSEDTTKL
jgi:hypothetical protein